MFAFKIECRGLFIFLKYLWIYRISPGDSLMILDNGKNRDGVGLFFIHKTDSM